MNRLHMFAMGALVVSFAACTAGVNDSENEVGTDQDALRSCGDDCPDPGGDSPTGGHTKPGGGSSGGSTGSGATPPPAPTPFYGLPQGLTGGLAYINHQCGLSLSSLVNVGSSAKGAYDACSNDINDPKCLPAAGGFLKAIITLGQNWCGDPTINLGGAVAGVPTIKMITASQFQVYGAPGWAVGSDGDRGNNASFGFYHQELTATRGPGITDTSKSTLFALPAGTACGFHQTQNTPANSLPGSGTCMGLDPALGQCPNGWRSRSHFDMSSDNGSFVWCEYLDPNNFCPNGSACELGAANAGYAIGVASDTDASGDDIYGASCPAGLTRSAWYDDGRGAGQGLGACYH